jgi:hypothetical protein
MHILNHMMYYSSLHGHTWDHALFTHNTQLFMSLALSFVLIFLLFPAPSDFLKAQHPYPIVRFCVCLFMCSVSGTSFWGPQRYGILRAMSVVMTLHNRLDSTWLCVCANAPVQSILTNLSSAVCSCVLPLRFQF